MSDVDSPLTVMDEIPRKPSCTGSHVRAGPAGHEVSPAARFLWPAGFAAPPGPLSFYSKYLYFVFIDCLSVIFVLIQMICPGLVKNPHKKTTRQLRVVASSRCTCT